MQEVLTADHLSTFASSILMDGFGTVGFLLLLFSALKNRRQKRKEAEAAELSSNNDGNLKPGETVVCGRVEHAEGAKSSVRVEVDQNGDESENSGTWYITWKETNRRVHVEPFYLKLASGDRIRVEPNAEVFLVDQLDGLIRVDLTHRIRYAELTPGERVYASGELVKAHDPEGTAPEGAYRSPRHGFVLRSPKRGRMLLASEPLAKRFRDRAEFYGSSAVLIFLVALIFHACFFGWHARRYHGRQDEATVTRMEVKPDGESEDFVVYFKTSNGSSLSTSVNRSAFATIKPGDVLPARYVYGPFDESTTLGGGNSVMLLAWLVMPLFLGTWWIYRLREGVTRPWYEREIIDNLAGRLSETLEQDKARERARAEGAERRREQAEGA